jgi:oligopeptide/dipeptide ABC transporter ATP-binding protein
MSNATVSEPPLLDVHDLTVDYLTPGKPAARALEGVSFHLRKGEMLGVVGESGCGKSTLMLSLLRLLPAAGRIVGGQINFQGGDLLNLREAEMAAVRWQQIAMIFQGAMNALNPVRTVGSQIAEPIQLHEGVRNPAVLNRRVDELLDLVGINPNRREQYPHQYSGGMRQRAMIAMALACSPAILIADEPTTALDVMVQAQILELLTNLRRQLGLAVLLVTHDLGVVAEICDTVMVMYGGVVAEYTDVDTIYNQPQHPYTQALLQAFPDIAHPTAKLQSIPGHPPRLDQLPPGCRFAPRCPVVFERCQVTQPALIRLQHDHVVSCHRIVSV